MRWDRSSTPSLSADRRRYHRQMAVWEAGLVLLAVFGRLTCADPSAPVCPVKSVADSALRFQDSSCLRFGDESILSIDAVGVTEVEVKCAPDHPEMGLPQLPASENENDVSVLYDSWLLKHPSALDTFEQMTSIANGRQIVVFLDYDGTLSNIVDNPEEAFMNNTMRMALREVGHYFPTAIISGRGRDKVYDFVQLDNVYYAGSHGLDIEAPLQSPNFGDSKHQSRVTDKMGNEVVLFQPAKNYLPAIQKIISALNEKTRSIRGVMIENNKFCLSVHYRHIADEDFCTLEKLVNSVMVEFKEFRVSKGKKVFEIRPDMEWDKGHALNYLLDTLGLGTSSDALLLYIGDDRTDEDAFKMSMLGELLRWNYWSPLKQEMKKGNAPS